MNSTRKSVIVGALAALIAGAIATWGQTHTVVTVDQQFTTASGHSLTGTYQCTGPGNIQCNLSGSTGYTGYKTAFVFPGGVNPFNASSQRFLGNGNVTPTLLEAEQRVPFAGTVKNLWCTSSVGVGTLPQKVSFGFLRNGLAVGGPSCFMPGVDSVTCSDTTGTATVSAGDLLVIVITPSNTPNTGLVGCTLELDPS